MFVSREETWHKRWRKAEIKASKAADKAHAATTPAQKLKLDELDYISRHQDLEDYCRVMEALKKICMHPKVEGFNPSKIELEVKAVYDKIKTDYEFEWEIYEDVKATKRKLVEEAEAVEDQNATYRIYYELHFAEDYMDGDF